jgi:hypothetical protein
VFNSGVRPVRPPAWVAVSFAVLAATLICAGPASAAPAPKWLGQTTPPGKEISPCNCSAWQFSDLNTAIGSYGIPYDGVIVKSAVKVGLTEPGDIFQPQTAHMPDANSGTVASQGAMHNTSALGGMLARFYERFPVHGGDVLGARFFHTGSFGIEYTSATFNSTSSTDVLATKTPGLTAGETFSGTSNGNTKRVNVEAWVEPDEDHDGYGDVSQDLCLGSPLANTACSGSLFGTTFEGFVANSGGAGSDSLYVQTALGAAPTALPARGVVVRWRVLGVPTFARDFQLRVLAPNGSGGYTVAGSSAAQTLPKNVNAEAGAIGTFATRLSVPVGGFVGIATDPTFTTPAIVSGAAGTTMSKLVDGGDGTNYASLPTTATSIVGYDADIEPDVDGDGYGDVSQDSCATDATIHEGPCPSTGGGTGSVGGGADSSSTPTGGRGSTTAAPKIKSLAVKPRRFRAKPIDGAVARGATGTKFKLDISAQAKSKVTLTIVKNGKRLWTLAKRLGPGRASVTYNGQCGKHGQVVALEPGSYVLMARIAGSGATKQTTFTVLPPA